MLPPLPSFRVKPPGPELTLKVPAVSTSLELKDWLRPERESPVKTVPVMVGARLEEEEPS